MPKRQRPPCRPLAGGSAAFSRFGSDTPTRPIVARQNRRSIPRSAAGTGHVLLHPITAVRGPRRHPHHHTPSDLCGRPARTVSARNQPKHPLPGNTTRRPAARPTALPARLARAHDRRPVRAARIIDPAAILALCARDMTAPDNERAPRVSATRCVTLSRGARSPRTPSEAGPRAPVGATPHPRGTTKSRRTTTTSPDPHRPSPCGEVRSQGASPSPRGPPLDLAAT